MSGHEVLSNPNKADDIGMRQLRCLSNLAYRYRLDLIADGLPIILSSAEALYDARNRIGAGSRAGQILFGLATEEAAKILILLDYVRCPPNLNNHASSMHHAFYNHGARLIYASACSWRPDTIATLRNYVDRTRVSHFVEGDYGQYILPNWDLYAREARPYADLTRTDTGALVWNNPNEWSGTVGVFDMPPAALRVSRAFSQMSLFSRQGLQVVHEVWRETAFLDKEHAQTHDRLIETTLKRLLELELQQEEAQDSDVRTIYHNWQMPMYAIELRGRPVGLEELRAEQDAQSYGDY